MIELWDLYDKDRNLIGRTHQRGIELEEGTYHLVIEAWTINKLGQILVTKRHPNKHFGLFWECTGGSSLTGETSVAAILRELNEEIGLKVSKDEVHLLGTITAYSYFVDTYITTSNLELHQFQLQEDEVVDVLWITLEELHTMGNQGLIVPFIYERFLKYENHILQYINEHTKSE